QSVYCGMHSRRVYVGGRSWGTWTSTRTWTSSPCGTRRRSSNSCGRMTSAHRPVLRRADLHHVEIARAEALELERGGSGTIAASIRPNRKVGQARCRGWLLGIAADML